MNKRKRLLMPIIFISGSIGLITINHVFSYYSFKANDINISISGISTKLGDDDYYLYWNNSNAPLALTKSSSNDNEYTYTIKTEDTGTYSYRIVDQNNKEVYSQDSFELGLYGDFNLSFNSENITSSLTYDFYIKDTYDLTESVDLYVTPTQATSWHITGSFSDWKSPNSIGMIKNKDNSSDLAIYKHLYLEKGTTFKITDYSTWLGIGAVKYGNNGYFTGTDNIEVSVSNYYDFCINKNYEISVSKSTDGNAFNWDDNKIEAVSSKDSNNNNVYTYTLDAVKYGNNDVYFNFLDSNKSKYYEDINVSRIKRSREILLGLKYIYLVPTTDYWNKDGAVLMGKASSDKTNYSMYVFNVCSTNSTYYYIEIPPDYNYIQFYRMSSGSTVDSYTIWNSVTTDQDISSNNAFQITGWDYSITTSVKPNDEAKFSLSTVD